MSVIRFNPLYAPLPAKTHFYFLAAPGLTCGTAGEVSGTRAGPVINTVCFTRHEAEARLFERQQEPGVAFSGEFVARAPLRLLNDFARRYSPYIFQGPEWSDY